MTLEQRMNSLNLIPGSAYEIQRKHLSDGLVTLTEFVEHTMDALRDTRGLCESVYELDRIQKCVMTRFTRETNDAIEEIWTAAIEKLRSAALFGSFADISIARENLCATVELYAGMLRFDRNPTTDQHDAQIEQVRHGWIRLVDNTGVMHRFVTQMESIVIKLGMTPIVDRKIEVESINASPIHHHHSLLESGYPITTTTPEKINETHHLRALLDSAIPIKNICQPDYGNGDTDGEIEQQEKKSIVYPSIEHALAVTLEPTLVPIQQVYAAIDQVLIDSRKAGWIDCHSATTPFVTEDLIRTGLCGGGSSIQYLDETVNRYDGRHITSVAIEATKLVRERWIHSGQSIDESNRRRHLLNEACTIKTLPRVFIGLVKEACNDIIQAQHISFSHDVHN